MKVSIILPVYNVEPYLAKCLDSILNQTLKDIEVICVNDCSPDNSLQILESYAAKDERVKVINHEQNLKLAGARNTGLDAATGEYVCFLDSDDTIEPDFCEKLYKLAKDSNADIAKGAYKIISSVDGSIKFCSNNNTINKNKYNFRFTLWTAIFKLDLLKKYNIKFVVDTIVFQMRAVHYADKIVTCDDAVYNYFRREDSNDSPVFSLEKWQSLNVRGGDLVLDFINSVDIEKENYVLLVRELILPLYFYGFNKLAKIDVPAGAEILADVLMKFWNDVRYKNDIKKSVKKYRRYMVRKDTIGLQKKLMNKKPNCFISKIIWRYMVIIASALILSKRRVKRAVARLNEVKHLYAISKYK